MDFSIVLPIYNVAPYLKNCFDSVARSIGNYHGLKTHEILLILDKPTDGSDAIAEELAKDRADVRIIRHADNRGLAEARNTALAHAQGDYMIWVDSDDWVSDDWYSAIAQAAERFSPDLFAIDHVVAYETRPHTVSDYGKRVLGLSEAAEIDPVQFGCDVLRSIDIMAFTWAKIMRRSVVSRFKYDAPRGSMEDMPMAVELMPALKSVVYIPKPIYYYRQRGDSMSGTFTVPKKMKHIECVLGKTMLAPMPYRQAAWVGLCQQFHDVRVAACKHAEDPAFAAASENCCRLMRMARSYFWRDPVLPFKAKLAYMLMSTSTFNGWLKRKYGG